MQGPSFSARYTHQKVIMICRLVPLALLALVLFVGCSATNNLEPLSPAATCDPFGEGCDPTTEYTSSAYAFTLTRAGYTGTGAFLLEGRSAKGQTLYAQFSSATIFREAVLNAYPVDPVYPVDPIRLYNDALATFTGDTAQVYDAVSGLVGGYKARVWVDKKTKLVCAFRPIP